VTPEAFVRAHTRLTACPLVPEIVLHLADEPISLWERTEDELRAGDQPPPFWAFAWAGGQALARYLLDHPQVVRGCSVLDVGAGSGLVAIAAARAGAVVVTAADIDSFAIAAIGLNAAANGVRLTVTQADLAGPGPVSTGPASQGPASPGPASTEPASTEPASTSTARAGLAQVLLAGDVCYDKAMTSPLIGFLGRARQAGREVLIGDPGRAYLPRDQLEPVAHYDVPVARVLEDADRKPATVWRLVR
jgi:predicted nicotinamide N-methyase